MLLCLFSKVLSLHTSSPAALSQNLSLSFTRSFPWDDLSVSFSKRLSLGLARTLSRNNLFLTRNHSLESFSKQPPSSGTFYLNLSFPPVRVFCMTIYSGGTTARSPSARLVRTMSKCYCRVRYISCMGLNDSHSNCSFSVNICIEGMFCGLSICLFALVISLLRIAE